jgi:hypothetical protein
MIMATFQPSLPAQQFSACEEFVAQVLAAVRTPRATSPLRRSVVAEMPLSGGLYAIYRDGSLNYVGEGGCLRERIGDLFETRHHSFRRALGELLFSAAPGFHKATTKRMFPADIESMLTKYMGEHLSILAIPLRLGRKEIEEQIVAGGGLLNKRGQRGR